MLDAREIHGAIGSPLRSCLELMAKPFKSLLQSGDLRRNSIELGANIGEVSLGSAQTRVVVSLNTADLCSDLLESVIHSATDCRVKSAAKSIQHLFLIYLCRHHR
ncbi:hypothetical protein ACTU6U_04265 [Microbacterium sp. A196]|uniref:hypothetical protein n=1 Tax=Microbacterium sp. A196 TaxID=3457320 RepID=UPI003FD6AB07